MQSNVFLGLCIFVFFVLRGAVRTGHRGFWAASLPNPAPGGGGGGLGKAPARAPLDLHRFSGLIMRPFRELFGSPCDCIRPKARFPARNPPPRPPWGLPLPSPPLYFLAGKRDSRPGTVISGPKQYQRSNHILLDGALAPRGGVSNVKPYAP